MKVLILNNDFRVYWKGRLLYLHTCLAQQGIELNAIELFGQGSPYTFDTVTSTHPWWTCLFPSHSSADLDKHAIKKAIFAALYKLQPDVIIAPSIVFYAGALGIAWAKQNGRKFIMFDDAKPTQVKRNFVVQWVKNLITSQVDGFWLPAKSYDADYALFKNRGVHFFYGFSSIDNELFKSPTGYIPANRTIISVARLVPIKNFEALLLAWQKIEQHNTGYSLLLLGNGPEEASLKQQAEILGLQSLRFVSAVGNDQLPAYLQQGSAFVLPSLSETWGLVVNEAMASGLPVLLSRNINAAADLLQEGQNGFSFDPYDIDAISNSILKFIQLTDADKLRMSERSLSLIETMSYQKMGIQLVEALKYINTQSSQKPGIISSAIISRWHGRYNTSGWDKL